VVESVLQRFSAVPRRSGTHVELCGAAAYRHVGADFDHVLMGQVNEIVREPVMNDRRLFIVWPRLGGGRFDGFMLGTAGVDNGEKDKG
jgi:hypothetical protein